MGYVLYYSNYCTKCQKILQVIVKSNNKNMKFYYICLDARKRDPETGKTIVITEDGKQIVIPPDITHVPALVILSEQRVIFGCDDIIQFLEKNMYGSGGMPLIGAEHANRTASTPKQVAATHADPTPYTLDATVGCGTSGFGVVSDKYSYVTDEKQLHNYVTMDGGIEIQTPKDNYKSQKIKDDGQALIDNLNQQRLKDVPAGNLIQNIVPTQVPN